MPSPDPSVTISILGPLEVRRDGVGVDVGGPKQRAVLAALAARPGEALSEDTLIDVVWAGNAPRSARNTLQTYVSNLRMAWAPEACWNGWARRTVSWPTTPPSTPSPSSETPA